MLQVEPKTVFRKNPCDFFRYGIGENEEDDGPYLPNLKYGLKPFLHTIHKN